MTIRHRIDLAGRRRHRFAVTTEVPDAASGTLLALPVWIPGSYMVREFAKHVVSITATRGGRAVALERADKTTWRVAPGAPGSGPLIVLLDVHAFDPSVRTAYLDERRAFWNHTSLCLRVVGREREPHALTVTGLPDAWELATTLPRDVAGDPNDFLAASGYDELCDHPVEAGTVQRFAFAAGGVPHEIAVTGAWPDFDGPRLARDAQAICEASIAFWGVPAPFDRYLFLLNATDESRGGLEHRASTALVARRRDLPRVGSDGVSDGHVDVLGLVAHEYFHAWNVKRLAPREFVDLDYGRENLTGLLWFFEGFTSYYDDLLVLRSGAIDAPRYLKLLGTAIGGVLGTPGRLVQSVAEASRDAWIKHYRPDENTPNATVSYYAKGSLVALALDLTLRREGRGTLDDVMRRLWSSSGGGAIDEGDILSALEAVGGRSFEPEIAAFVHGTGDLPLRELLGSMGIAWSSAPPTVAQRLGLRVSESALTGVRATHVLAGGAAEAAGFSPGDELLAVDGWRLRRLDEAERLASREGASEWLVGREQRVVALRLEGGGWRAPQETGGAVTLAFAADAEPAVRARRSAWLGSGHGDPA
jgi:predicted metalloprotease with PDZ domain